jgi:hypothetical protein
MTILIFVADDKANVCASFERVVPLEDEALVLYLDKGEASGNAG